jgi:hypothetical protein
MSEFSGFLEVICNRWIDEVQGTRCVLAEGHDGPCMTGYQVAAAINKTRQPEAGK